MRTEFVIWATVMLVLLGAALVTAFPGATKAQGVPAEYPIVCYVRSMDDLVQRLETHNDEQVIYTGINTQGNLVVITANDNGDFSILMEVAGKGVTCAIEFGTALREALVGERL